MAPAGPTRTERVHAQALALLERHGVLTREAVAAEAVDGGFSAVYPVLRAMEEAGRIRRGYFVDGLGAAQFALPGAARPAPGAAGPARRGRGGPRRAVHLLAAADPANPYGAALPWPRRGDDDRRSFQRAAGAYVVLVDGAAVLYLDRGGTSLQVLPAAEDADAAGARARGRWRDLVADGRVRELVIGKVDGEPVGLSAHRAALLGAGFVPGYRGLVPAASRRRSAGRTRCPRATRSAGPPPGSARTSSAGP